MLIVTGGAGFIGSALIWELNQRGFNDITVVDNLASSEKWQNMVSLKIRDYVHKDVFIEGIRKNPKALKGIKGIIHLGACSSTMEQNADYLMSNNFHYTRDLFTAAASRGIRFINASSAATYGDGSNGFDGDISKIPSLRPLNMYGYTKQLFDQWSLDTGAVNSLVSLKFFNVYGPNEYHKGMMQSVVCKSVPQIQEHGSISLFESHHPDYKDGESMRDFVYVKDVVKLIVWLLKNPKITGIYNVGQGQARSWKDLANAVFNAMALEANIKIIPMPEQLKEKYQYFTEANMDWLKQVGYPLQFSSLEEGVTDYVQNYLLKENKYLA